MLFKINKYTKWYFGIMNSAKIHKENTYYELHHIIPRCLGGTDDDSNIVKLTAREHYIAHLLLVKMNDSHKLKFALHMMQVINYRHDRYIVKSSRMLEYIKKENSEASKRRNSTRIYKSGYVTAISTEGVLKRFDTVEDIPKDWVRSSPTTGTSINKGKRYVTNEETKQVKTIGIDENLPTGWVFGNVNAKIAARLTNIKGTRYFYDPHTGIEGRFDSRPVGWLDGRSVLWYNNGTINKQFNKLDNPPAEWRRGRIMKRKNK